MSSCQTELFARCKRLTFATTKMYTFAISQIIQDTYESVRTNDRGFLITFSVNPDYDVEDGYRYRDLIVFAPKGMRYVFVMYRDRWNVCPNGSDTYDKGQSEWRKLSYHDSCWRHDGVQDFINFFAADHGIIQEMQYQNSDLPDVQVVDARWYATFEPSDDLVQYARKTDYYSIRRGEHKGLIPS